MMTTKDIEALPDAQRLTMFLLAARVRTGEYCWTFDERDIPTLEALRERGLLRYERKTGPDRVLVWISEEGIAACISPDYTPPIDVMLGHYSAALDEIYRLRQVAALATTRLDRVLELRTLPKTAAAALAELQDRLGAAARGETEAAYADVPSEKLTKAMDAVGACPVLTRQIWELRA